MKNSYIDNEISKDEDGNEILVYKCPICGKIISEQYEEGQDVTPCKHLKFHAFLSNVGDGPVWEQYGDWKMANSKSPEKYFCKYIDFMSADCGVKEAMDRVPETKAVDLLCYNDDCCEGLWSCDLFGFKE